MLQAIPSRERLAAGNLGGAAAEREAGQAAFEITARQQPVVAVSPHGVNGCDRVVVPQGVVAARVAAWAEAIGSAVIGKPAENSCTQQEAAQRLASCGSGGVR